MVTAQANFFIRNKDITHKDNTLGQTTKLFKANTE